MVQYVQQHLAIVFNVSTLDIILPGRPILVQFFSGHKKLVFRDKVLIHKGLNKHEITEIFPNMKNEVTALTGFCIKLFSLIRIQKPHKFKRVFPFVRPFFNVAE